MKFDPGNENVDQNSDARTLLILREIANSIDTAIQFEVDYPSLHENGRLPVLDLNMFIANDKIEFGFFRKPIASPFLILYKSAINSQTKRNSILQDGLRRLRNLSPGIGQSERIQTLNFLSYQMLISGYDQHYRVNMIKGILERQDQVDQQVRDGTFVKYRSRDQIMDAKSKKLGKHPNTWFLDGTHVNTLKVMPSPVVV